ncbi:hypothetical protein Ancab_011038 [Ancistrocladus abbreviatus]
MPESAKTTCLFRAYQFWVVIMAARVTSMVLASDQNSDSIVDFFDDKMSFSAMVFGFLDENFTLSSNFSDESLDARDLGDYFDNSNDSISIEKNKAFWDEQDKLLQAILCRTTSVETKVRNAAKEALKELKVLQSTCVCRSEVVGGGCQNCIRRDISQHLCNAGFNCFVRKSKWKSSSHIPSGEHTYLEVVEKSSSKNGQVRVIIELNFRADFEMAKASEEYNLLINRLPQVFVGKPETLQKLIKILCGAAKKCMKDKKMHLAPWRKHKYMKAKWLSSTYEPSVVATPLSPMVFPNRPPKPRTSMLTCILLENISGSYPRAVEVL